MAGCILRVRKEGVGFEALLSLNEFESAIIFKDGFNLVISERESFIDQLYDCEKFLSKNVNVCKDLEALLRPVSPNIDFGIWKNEGPVQSVTFPHSILKLAVDAGLEITTSTYEASDL